MRKINKTPKCISCDHIIHFGVMYIIKNTGDYICENCHCYSEKVMINHKPGE
jgi:hypothetical protein